MASVFSDLLTHSTSYAQEKTSFIRDMLSATMSTVFPAPVNTVDQPNKAIQHTATQHATPNNIDAMLLTLFNVAPNDLTPEKRQQLTNALQCTACATALFLCYQAGAASQVLKFSQGASASEAAATKVTMYAMTADKFIKHIITVVSRFFLIGLSDNDHQNDYNNFSKVIDPLLRSLHTHSKATLIRGSSAIERCIKHAFDNGHITAQMKTEFLTIVNSLFTEISGIYP